MNHLSRFFSPPTAVAASLFAAAAFVPTTAFAQNPGSDPCGGIELSAIGECHFEFEGGCEAKCEPLSFVAACDGQCNLSVEASCDTSCQASCAADCEVDPGQFDCRASCTADCRASAEARCGTDSECVSYFQAECSSSCEAECNVVPPSADCEAQCNGCCTGSCDVDANFDCSLQCTADLKGGCQVDCRQPEGALFCDGQYLAVVDLPACLQYLAENFEINLEVEAEASGSITCSMGNPALTDGSALYAMMAGGLGLAFASRRRRRRRQ